MANGLLDSLPPGFSDWDDYDRYRKQTGPSMRPSYSNKFTEFLATNPVTGFLVPGAERFLQKGQKPNIWDVGIAAADVALPMIPLAGMVKKFPGKDRLREGLTRKGYDPDSVLEKSSSVVKLPTKEFDQHAVRALPWSPEKVANKGSQGAPIFEKIGTRVKDDKKYVKVRDNRSGMTYYEAEDFWNNPRMFDDVDDIPSWEEQGREMWEDHFQLVLEKEYPATSSEWKDIRTWYVKLAEKTGRDFNPKASRQELFDEIIDDGSVNLFDFGPYSEAIDYFDEDIADWIFNLMKRYPDL